LEVAANPYATMLGAPESSERRLNLAQSFNAVGAVVALLVVGPLILTATAPSAAELAGLSPAGLQAYRASQTATVRIPYLVIGGKIPAASSGGLHDRAIRRLRAHEIDSRVAPARLFRLWRAPLRGGRDFHERCHPDLRGGVDRILSLDHVSDDFRPGHQESWPLHQAR